MDEAKSTVARLLTCIWLFATPWTAARQASLSITNSWSLLKLMSIELVMPSDHLILCRPLLLPPSVFPSIRVFSNESALCIRWSRYWSFSFSISPSIEHSGRISFRKWLVGSAYCPRDPQEHNVKHDEVKWSRHRRLHMFWFHLHEVSRVGKFLEKECMLVVVRVWGKGLQNGQLCVSGDEKVQQLVMMVAVLTTKTSELYSLNESFLCMWIIYQ